MESSVHSLSNLFAQLGLPAGDADITGFIETHGPLPARVALADAPFWTPSQAGFLREELLGDADWVQAIDALNENLHG